MRRDAGGEFSRLAEGCRRTAGATALPRFIQLARLGAQRAVVAGICVRFAVLYHRKTHTYPVEGAGEEENWPSGSRRVCKHDGWG